MTPDKPQRIIAGHSFNAGACPCGANSPVGPDFGPDICPLNASGTYDAAAAVRYAADNPGAELIIMSNRFSGLPELDPGDTSARSCACGMVRGEEHRKGCPLHDS